MAEELVQLVAFNLNHKVRVKLTETGKEAMKENHRQLYCDWKQPPEFRPRKEDEEGWSEWQLWDLMNELGRYCIDGPDVPFEPSIRLEFPAPTVRVREEVRDG